MKLLKQLRLYIQAAKWAASRGWKPARAKCEFCGGALFRGLSGQVVCVTILMNWWKQDTALPDEEAQLLFDLAADPETAHTAADCAYPLRPPDVERNQVKVIVYQLRRATDGKVLVELTTPAGNNVFRYDPPPGHVPMGVVQWYMNEGDGFVRAGDMFSYQDVT